MLVDVQQIIPIPEAAEYQVQLRKKEERSRLSKKMNWDEAKFFPELKNKAGEKAAEIAKELLEWSRPLVDYVWFGEGESIGSFTPTVKVEREKYHLFAVKTHGKIVFRFSELKHRRNFQDDRSRLSLLEKLNQIPGVNFPLENLQGHHKIPLRLLEPPESLDQFKDTILWMISLAKGEGKGQNILE